MEISVTRTYFFFIHLITNEDNFITKFEAIVYWCETWSLTLRDEQRLEFK